MCVCVCVCGRCECVCVCVRERERERERESVCVRERERERDRQTESWAVVDGVNARTYNSNPGRGLKKGGGGGGGGELKTKNKEVKECRVRRHGSAATEKQLHDFDISAPVFRARSGGGTVHRARHGWHSFRLASPCLVPFAHPHPTPLPSTKDVLRESLLPPLPPPSRGVLQLVGSPPLCSVLFVWLCGWVIRQKQDCYCRVECARRKLMARFCLKEAKMVVRPCL